MFVYASQKRNVQFSFLFEIYSGWSDPDSLTLNNLSFKHFNPNSQLTKDYYVSKWAKAINMAFEEIVKKVTI